MSDAASLFFVPLRVIEDIDDIDIGQEDGGMDRPGRDEIPVPRGKYFVFPFDSEIHLSLDHESPLGAVGVGRQFSDGFDIEEDNLLFSALEKPAFDSLDRDVDLGKDPDHLRIGRSLPRFDEFLHFRFSLFILKKGIE